MKSWRLITALLLGLIVVSLVACNPLKKSTSEDQQLVKVVSGNLTVTVSGSGNIEASRQLSLSFSSSGRIDKIYVKEGDKVSKDDVLATLDTYEWETRVTSLERQLFIAQRSLTAKKKQVTADERQVSASELTLRQAQINLQTAQYNLSQIADVKTEQDAVDAAQTALDVVKANLELAPGLGAWGYWVTQLPIAQQRLADAQQALRDVLTGSSAKVTTSVALQVATNNLQVQQAQMRVEDAQIAIDDAKTAVDDAKIDVENAKIDVEQAQKALDEVKNTGPEVKAPFDGVVTRVDVEEGDTVSAIIPIIYLMDPASKELVVEVDELDVTEVTPGQKVNIEVDALPGLKLEGKVSSISLLPTQAAGVVVYDVKIGFDAPADLGLRLGMSATADIIIAERKNVLLVPDRAINQDSQGRTTVEIRLNEQTAERKVVIGVSDGTQTEIVSGLKEGEVVVERRTKAKS